MSGLLLAAAVLTPLALASLLMVWRGALRLAPWAALPALATAWWLPPGTMVELPFLMAGGLWGLDATGRTFLVFTALLWLTGGWYAAAYVGAGRQRFFVFFLLAMAGNVGLVLAHDLLTFYLFFAVMSFASYGLVVHEGSPQAWRAGRIYISLVVLGEVLLFAALVTMAAAAGGLDFPAARTGVAASPWRDLLLLLLVLGFGIKAGLVGVHVWLPLAHPVAPTPASAVLSGAMIKAGILGWLRLLPLGETTLPGWGGVLMVAGILGAFYGVLVGLTQRDPKVVLAYSSISQMGILTCGVGAGLAVPAAWPALGGAVVFYALHHGLTKGVLFLGVGVAGKAAGGHRYWVGTGLLLSALVLAGAPLTGGMLAKDVLKAALPAAGSGGLVGALLPWTSLATALLLLRFLQVAWPRAGAPAAAGGWKVMAMAWLVLLGATAILPWMLLPVEAPALTGVHLLGAGWPVAAALGVAWAAVRLPWRLPAVPAGDVLEPALAGIRAALRHGRAAGGWFHALGRRRVPGWWPFLARQVDRGEALLLRWPVAALIFLGLIVAAALLASSR